MNYMSISRLNKLVLYLFTVTFLFSCKEKSVTVVEKVDVFWGVGKREKSHSVIQSNHTDKIANKWSSPKPSQGNLHPGAILPFHLVSVSPYGSGYPTGYDSKIFQGFTHFHQSGTGYIMWFYNYLLISPMIDDTLKPIEITEEIARPGYYQMKSKQGVNARASVWDYVSYIQYEFPESQQATIQIDFSHVYNAPKKGFPSSIEYEFLNSGLMRAKVVMGGIPIYFVINPIESLVKSSLTPQKGVLNFEEENDKKSFIWKLQSENAEINCITAISLKSFEQAEERLLAAMSLDDAAQKSVQFWESNLSKIHIEGISNQIDTLFYSALYRSFIKPIYAPNDHPFSDSVAYFTDFATWWDAYQTQIPLLNLLYPDMSESMFDYLSESLNRYEYWRTADLMSAYPITNFDNQGTAIAPIAIMEAWKRTASVEKTAHIYNGVKSFLSTKEAKLMESGGLADLSAVQHVDYAYAYYLSSQLASAIGQTEFAKKLDSLSKTWDLAYNRETKLLKGDQFYEAGTWNYSFKPWWDSQRFIAFQGGIEAFSQRLDSFFGYDDSEVNLPFEGLNNEVDMSVPYWYIELGKPEKTQEIIRATFSNRIGLGRGGLPGNEDSGALSSWIVWNTLGLYPKPAFDAYLIGSPLINRATLELKNAKITIKVHNNSEKNLYVVKAIWNGTTLEKLELNGNELRKGGTLEIWMNNEYTKKTS